MDNVSNVENIGTIHEGMKVALNEEKRESPQSPMIFDPAGDMAEESDANVNVENIELSESFTGRAFPDAVDGTPQSYTSKTQMEESAEAKIEKPRQDKLERADIGDVLKECKDAIETITQYEKDRSEVNAEISAVREKLEALGISKKALSMAISYSKMSTDQRDGFDLAYKILRKAIGEPMRQIDMFKDSLSDSIFNADE